MECTYTNRSWAQISSSA